MKENKFILLFRRVKVGFNLVVGEAVKLVCNNFVFVVGLVEWRSLSYSGLVFILYYFYVFLDEMVYFCFKSF